MLITAAFLLFDRGNFLTLAASLIGVTSLIFNAKGNPLGQLLIVAFSLLYGMISFTFAYYGEMLTYLGMTAPMAVVSLVSWLKHPYNGQRAEVQVSRMTAKQVGLMLVLTTAVTAVFAYLLAALHTAYLLPSTISVTTSFLAVYLTFRRSAYYAAAYAANDMVLIVLWTLASFTDLSYLSVVVCFAVFLANDIYGFISWSKMQKRQEATVAPQSSGFREMRRKNQLLSKEESVAVLERGTSGVLALAGDNGYPYAVPISYVYDSTGIYFHGAKTGHKTDAIKQQPKVSFCVIDRDDVIPQEYTTYFKSVIVFGEARILTDEQEITEAAERLAVKYFPNDSAAHRRQVIEKERQALCMVKISVTHMTGKQARELGTGGQAPAGNPRTE